MERISVIIPVYNAEKYISRCLDSVLMQSHENLQIIVVDDGSTDDSGNICARYAERDCRIQLLHTEHAGVAAARETGLQKAAGRYIGWVDADDCISADMYEYLLSGLLESSAPIAVCGYFRVAGGRKTQVSPCQKIIRQEDALRYLLSGRDYSGALWNKLFDARLFHGVSFPAGLKMAEDLSVLYRLFEKAQHVVLLPDAKYYYVQNPSSIMHEGSLANVKDDLTAHWLRYEALVGRYPEFEPVLSASMLTAGVRAWEAAAGASKEMRAAAAPELEKINRFAREKGCAASRSEYEMGGLMRLSFLFLRFNLPLSYRAVQIMWTLYNKCKRGGLLSERGTRWK